MKTKIAIVAPKREKEQSDIGNFTAMMSVNIIKHLEAHPEIEIVKRIPSASPEEGQLSTMDLNGATHIFGIVLRFWSYFPDKVLAIKKRIPGELFQFYDTGKRPGIERYVKNFTLLDWAFDPQRDIHIGWAANPEVFHINKTKRDETLRILIDHPLWAKGADRTDDISQQCLEFKNNPALLEKINAECGTNFKNVSCRRLVSGGIEDVTSEKVNGKFNKHCVSQDELAKEYAKAHIFFMSHGESLGMCVLEAAMSGCMVCSPEGFIKDVVLNFTNHSVFGPKIDWISACKGINPIENRKKVEHWTWEASVDKIAKALIKFDPTRK